MNHPTRQITSDKEIKSQIHKRAGMQHISTHVCSHEWKVNHIKNCVYTTRLFNMAMRGTAKKLTFTECEIQSFAAGAVGGLSYYLRE